MNFDDFKSEFQKENRKLRIFLTISLIVFSVGTVTSLTQRQYYLYRGKSVFEERLLAVEVCRLSFLSLVKGKPNSALDLVKKDPFEINVSKIMKLSSTEEGSCKLVLTSGPKLLAFKILLESDESHPFYYRLKEIEELSPEENG